MNQALSAKTLERATRLIPGGVNSPARAFGAVGGQPIVIARGEGPYLYDLDGNRFVDYVGSWGPLILGHAHPRVVESIVEAAHRGTSYGAPVEAETELAELVTDAFDSVEMVRFVNSGTEASMSAIRLARGFTGRDRIVKFAGCYHGHVDSLLVQAGSSATTLGVPNSPGIPEGCIQDTIPLQFNDPDGVKFAFLEHGDNIACVILEPIPGNMGLVLPTKEFLATLHQSARKAGALVIYDEVMTGFRVALGGAQEYLKSLNLMPDDTPDLTVLGKIIGGGLPVGAYGGRADVMQEISPTGPVFQAGTLSGNPLAMAAGVATLRELKDNPPYEKLDSLAGKLADGLSDALRSNGFPHVVQRAGSMLTVFFADWGVIDYPSAVKCDTERFAKFFWHMMESGVYLPCSQFEALFVSAAHDEKLINATVDAARRFT